MVAERSILPAERNILVSGFWFLVFSRLPSHEHRSYTMAVDVFE